MPNTAIPSANITPKGRQLPQIAIFNKSTGISTNWPSDKDKIQSVFVLCGIAYTYVSIAETIDLTSDHTAIVPSLSESVMTKKHRPQLTNKLTDGDEF